MLATEGLLDNAGSIFVTNALRAPMATKKSLAIKSGPASLRRNMLLLALLFIGTAALRGAGDTRWPLLTKLINSDRDLDIFVLADAPMTSH